MRNHTFQRQAVRGEKCLVKGRVLQKTKIWIPKQNRPSQISSLRLSIVTPCPQYTMQIPLPINALRLLSSRQLLQLHGPRFQLHGTFPAEGTDPVYYLFSSLPSGRPVPITGNAPALLSTRLELTLISRIRPKCLLLSEVSPSPKQSCTHHLITHETCTLP